MRVDKPASDMGSLRLNAAPRVMAPKPADVQHFQAPDRGEVAQSARHPAP